jgi:hypothetical protein
VNQLEQEKRLVAEFMGWEWIIVESTGLIRHYAYIHKDGEKTGIQPKYWNPQTDRNAWPEIWDKMDEETMTLYLMELGRLLPNRKWSFHIASPEVCWKALIEVLEGK